MEKTNTKAKLVLALFLMALLLSGAQGGRFVPDNKSTVIATNAYDQQLGLLFELSHYAWLIKKWFFWKWWFSHFPLKADLNKRIPGSKTTADASVAASTVFP